LVEAHYVDADTRVRRRLLELARTYGSGDGAVVSLKQEELAAMADTSRATVNRVLREEQRRGAVALSRGQVTLLEPDELERRCGRG
jgi:CRP/FNR family transcriptional regulator, cyclic AMP receptor protein